MPASPKKKRSKHKASDSDPKALEGKAALVKRAIFNEQDVWVQGQETSQSKGATSLDPDTPANPLAPELSHKGRRSRSKTPVISAPTFKLSNLQPTFAQWEAGGRYRFSPPIIPPGTEPDLQALNNSFVAAAKGAHALPDPNYSRSQTHVTTFSMSQHCVPVIGPNASQGHHTATTPSIKDPVLSSTTSTTMALPDANFYRNLDPGLQPTEPLGTESEQSDTFKDDSSGLDKNSGDEQMGWGEVHGHHSAHPGFLREELLPQPRVVTALPTDFEFQYSRNEGDQVAGSTLAVGGDLCEDSSDDGMTMDQESASQPNVVLKVKQKQKQKQKSKSKQKLKVVDGSKSDDEGPKATQLGWYSPHWKSFLKDVKVECCTQQALENPFPSLVHDLLVSITESLSASLVQWLKNGQQVDAGVWPTYKPDMLYDDLATWHSNLKKTAISIIPSTYGLFPPADIPIQECTAWVEAAAVELLDDGRFLCYGLDELGKTRNFAHPALLEGTILFFYTGSYHIAHRRPAIFRKEVPLKCLALVCTVFHCVFQGLKKNSSGKCYSKFTSKEYESIYHSMLGLLDDVMKDPYHGPKLVQQLREWARIGWAEASKLNGINTSKHCHLHVQLD
ncbi:hypothetical protein DFH29DRAFT_880027 [Suillus ampliporus]|nr:hypothetical protein DFH29DRAFT_880027 [Suillus ampliporus]